MRLVTGGAMLLVGLVGCAAPEIRFTRTQCLPVVGDEQTEAVRFISDFEANGAVPEQQLVYQVAVVDGAGRPVQSRTGKYKDVSGNLMAAKGVMLLQSPWVFENINVAIPTPELNAAREDGAVFAEFRLASPDGQVLARERVRLPAEFAAASPAREAPIARATEERARRDEPQPTEAPQVASAAGEPQRREPPREDRGTIQPAGEPPVARNETSAAQPAARRSSAARRPDTIVRESRPASPPRTAETPAPPAAAGRDQRAATSRRPTRETEIESVAPREPEKAAGKPAKEPSPPEAPAGRGGQEETVYTVKAADSLRSISLEHYGDAQYWPLILRANPDVNPLKLKAGDRLVLPALDEAGSARMTAPRTAEKGASDQGGESPVYVTKEGDTLPQIARQLYGDSRRWREIYDLNRDQLDSPSGVRAGQRLKLPEPARAGGPQRRPASP